MDIAAARTDAWITREPHYPEPVQPRCMHCGAFLSYAPDDTIYKEQSEPCDGKRMVFHGVYTEDDRGLLDIIGWDKLGQSYIDERAAPCDSLHEHDPHTYIVHSWCESHWACRKCDQDSVIIEY